MRHEVPLKLIEILQQQDFQDCVAYIPYRKNAVTQFFTS